MDVTTLAAAVSIITPFILIKARRFEEVLLAGTVGALTSYAWMTTEMAAEATVWGYTAMGFLMLNLFLFVMEVFATLFRGE